jgi:hypothetical protein
MQGKRPVTQPFSAALWLTPEPTAHSQAMLAMGLHSGPGAETPIGQPALEALRIDNPAARCLPLLELLARQSQGTVQLATAGGQWLQLAVEPC